MLRGIFKVIPVLNLFRDSSKKNLKDLLEPSFSLPPFPPKSLLSSRVSLPIRPWSARLRREHM